jgi:lipopolysaccharide biosynthesis glycosyltransferase
MIPYNKEYRELAQVLTHFSDVTVYKNLQLIEDFEKKIAQICDKTLLKKPNLLRKLLCWLGDFDEFIYIDTDVVVFDKIANNFDYLNNYDFISYDYQYKSGIKEVFEQSIEKHDVFTEQELKDVFNSGFWISRKGIFPEEAIWETIRFRAEYPEFFDSLPTTDQPILNYLILKYVPNRFNLARSSSPMPGNWAGSPHFKSQNNILIDPTVNKPLQFIHWAGMRTEPGCLYFDIWEYYRHLNTSFPPATFPDKAQKNSLRKRASQLRGYLKKLQF